MVFVRRHGALLITCMFTLFTWACSGNGDNAAANNTTQPDMNGGVVEDVGGEIVACVRGLEGCSCDEGGVCQRTTSGQQLACVLGVCEIEPCTPGQAGCACDAGACGDGLECSSASGVERCEVTGCEAGSVDCGCTLARGCDAGAVCQQGLCVAADCEIGTEGCACSSRFICESGLACDLSTDSCVDADVCLPGDKGCECAENSRCDGDLTCMNDRCVDPDCSPGLQGCTCAEDDRCGLGPDGQEMGCADGICEIPDCPAGETGCACEFGTKCELDTDVCSDGYCKPIACIPGQLDCDCNRGSCDPGLTCEGGTICVDNTGKKGGACLPDQTCERGLRCDDSINPAACVHCDLGSIGCQCDDSDECTPGLTCMANGHCAGDETVFQRSPPIDPICVTPCRSNLVEESGTRFCVDGFFEGCLDGQTCDKGSCVPDGDAANICFQDSDCPDFQLCMQGYCYTECGQDSACASGEVCHKRVCRQRCTLSDTESCSDGLVCSDSDDGQTGYCMRLPSETGRQSNPQQGRVTASKTVLEMSNTKIQDTITITNDSDNYVTVTVRKVEHDALMADKSKDQVIDYDPNSSCTAAGCPLWWLEMGEFGSISPAREITLTVPPRCTDDCPVVTIRIANNGQAVDTIRWRGVLELQSEQGSDRIDLSYVSTADGRWVGNMLYFANFETEGLDTTDARVGWLERANKDDVSGVKNGLIQRWGAFRKGEMSDGWRDMKAVLTATETGQWQWPNVAADCIVSDGACYLFDGGAGALPRPYVTSLASAPIPAGVSEFPMAMNLYTNGPDASKMSGRVVSEAALHYAGNPAVAIEFLGDPSNTATCDADVQTNCVNFIDMLDVKVSNGGRYAVAPDATGCEPGFELASTPWLVPGFLSNTSYDPSSGRYSFQTCVDARLPYFGTSDPDELIANANLAWSNPIPNGRVLEREVEILDGAMIDQSEIFILFRETYPSFIDPTESFTAYGYMLLERQPIQISPEDLDGDGAPDAYEGSSPPDMISDGGEGASVSCSRELLDKAIGANVSLTNANAGTAIRNLIEGGVPSASDRIGFPSATSGEEVHYLCEETGLFDGGGGHTSRWGQGGNGPNSNACVTSANGVCEDGGFDSSASTCAIGTDVTDCGFRYTDTRIECPAKSNVTFFTTNRNLLRDIHAQDCQQDGTCMDTLNDWIANKNPLLMQVDPKWICEGDAVFCDDNALDRREGKLFFKANSSNVPFLALRAEIEDAFRYKTRFRSRDGSTVGFVPSECIPFSTSTPYCYDAEKIEALRDRVDCLLDVYDRYYDSVSGSSNPQAEELYTYLEENFGAREEPSPTGGLPTTYDGFERLYSELLIMLGDDAYTDAFESRFDLAGSLAASFEGSRFEESGLELSGISGFEMFKLYQAVQYYDMVLDRFYAMGDVLGASLRSGESATSRNFISPETVTMYFDRLIRASTQRSRALAEIARRYQNFNRPDLAQRVTERAYTATYLESVVLANLIVAIYDSVGGLQRPEILAALEQSQLRYRMALLDLSNVVETITQDINYFGYPVDYIPFPALDNTSTVSAESNAFEKVLRTSLSKLSVAKTREQTALQQTRTYETDEASFQAELTRISRTYENQLGDICGLFTGTDGVTYPAVERFAYLDERLSIIGSPCGFAGNGAIHRAVGELEQRELEIRQIAGQIQNTLDDIEITRDLAEQQCNIQLSNADYQAKVGDKVFKLNEQMVKAQQTAAFIQRRIDNVKSAIEIFQCSQDECMSTGTALNLLATTAIATEVAIKVTQDKAKKARKERQEIAEAKFGWDASIQCQALRANSDASMARLMLRLRDMELSMLGAEYRLSLALSEIGRQRQKAKRLELEWDEALQMSINVQAARNDPNVRIYRNDSVLNADIAFEDALREAYRLTLVYEYYTSTTYAARDQLFLIRMIAAGDYNLENYIYELSNAFTQFEEEYGLPELRLEILSLQDDILQIPKLDANGEALSTDARAALVRERLKDPGMLSPDGYITIPFGTSLERLSPLTRNHKLYWIEANIRGSGNGDYLGRLYLRQVGTGVIHNVDDDYTYYRFPDMTAVINPYFNNQRQLSETPDLYKSFRLRDRPLVNTGWELVFNQRDEYVNQDINIEELEDIILYVYYTDFTVY